MNFKSFTTASLLIAGTLFVASCNNNKKATAEEVKGNKTTVEQTSNELKLAYVDLDTLQTKYQFFIDAKNMLEEKSQRYDSEMNRMGNNLQNAAAAFQKKIQENQFTSQAQAENEQKRLMNQQNNLEQKRAKYAQELMEDQMKFNTALVDSVNNFIKAYNQSHHYTMILSKQGTNILLADKSMDITNEVVAGLNKRYKKK